MIVHSSAETECLEPLSVSVIPMGRINDWYQFNKFRKRRKFHLNSKKMYWNSILHWRSDFRRIAHSRKLYECSCRSCNKMMRFIHQMIELTPNEKNGFKQFQQKSAIEYLKQNRNSKIRIVYSLVCISYIGSRTCVGFQTIMAVPEPEHRLYSSNEFLKQSNIYLGEMRYKAISNWVLVFVDIAASKSNDFRTFLLPNAYSFAMVTEILVRSTSDFG